MTPSAGMSSQAESPANIGAVLHGINDLRIEPLDMPVIADDHVLLAVKSVGICGSDGTRPPPIKLVYSHPL